MYIYIKTHTHTHVMYSDSEVSQLQSKLGKKTVSESERQNESESYCCVVDVLLQFNLVFGEQNLSFNKKK